MKPYKTIRFITSPDLADIRQQGRKTSVGSLPTKGGDFRGVQKSKKRRQIRRYLKRADSARLQRQIQKENEW
jgi:hypothetical protein